MKWNSLSGVETLEFGGSRSSGANTDVVLDSSAFSAGIRTIRGVGAVNGNLSIGPNNRIDASSQTDSSIALTLTVGGTSNLTSSDTLIGGAGNDSLQGNLGADSLEGGSGADTYTLGSLTTANDNAIDTVVDAGSAVSKDTISGALSGFDLIQTGFAKGQDVLNFNGGTGKQLGPVINH